MSQRIELLLCRIERNTIYLFMRIRFVRFSYCVQCQEENSNPIARLWNGDILARMNFQYLQKKRIMRNR